MGRHQNSAGNRDGPAPASGGDESHEPRWQEQQRRQSVQPDKDRTRVPGKKAGARHNDEGDEEQPAGDAREAGKSTGEAAIGDHSRQSVSRLHRCPRRGPRAPIARAALARKALHAAPNIQG